ncbi:aminotransferase class I/II-fold pyridoxal phosphate-dependent enzyme [Synechococcus sp. RSCCF101]|uniref:pyridoxal phosphate-dependent aminotransferase n=1 Tax=Synechococcus sp. RSCCF101 TaxID=2511069 RepID=UPI001249217E|nr:aminotransferase class I/II-fold pyridoxal phosphate-dependent enzyme [Synechococcus sp. RSCCF101]QEY32814.1 aminotransferase class I/II-fold pyridoxal phosphate-dependent enzyme [Synechococcus sp. RSCCF101]
MHSPDPLRHGGNRWQVAAALGCRPEALLDASASLVPFGPPASVRRALHRALRGPALRAYPDRGHTALRAALAAHHGLPPEMLLPGNGAAELFTWAARDAAAAGLNLLPQPGFADYDRALACWGAAPCRWNAMPGAALPPERLSDGAAPPDGAATVLWICNPHNPTGALWRREALLPLLERHALVVCDEAFLPLVPGGEAHSLVPLVPGHENLVVIRSLTKLLAVPGLRLGYAVASPARLQRWAGWRDPWPVNGLAAAVAQPALADGRWLRRVQAWVAREGPWLQRQLAALPDLEPLPTSANFLLLRGAQSLEPLRGRLEREHRVLLRSCRSFTGLGPSWLRLSLQDRAGNRRLLRALRQATASTRSASRSARR